MEIKEKPKKFMNKYLDRVAFFNDKSSEKKCMAFYKVMC